MVYDLRGDKTDTSSCLLLWRKLPLSSPSAATFLIFGLYYPEIDLMQGSATLVREAAQ
jgi:hypothetical protein